MRSCAISYRVVLIVNFLVSLELRTWYCHWFST